MKPQDFFEKAIRGTIDEGDVRALIAASSGRRRRPPSPDGSVDSGESQFHDFKSATTISTNKFRRDIRRDIVAFANTSGGCLMVGVDQRDGGFVAEGVSPTAGDLKSWFATVMDPIRGQLLEQPVAREIVLGDVRVWIVATARNQAGLVFAPGESQELVLPMRIDDSTIDAPAYLVTDLLVGRRSHPHFRGRAILTASHSHGMTGQTTDIRVSIDVENTSFVHADDCHVIFVRHHVASARSQSRVYDKDMREMGLSPSLHSMIDADSEHAPALSQMARRVGTLEPFVLLPLANFDLALVGHVSRLRAAVFVVYRGGPPAMFQIDADTSPEDPGRPRTVVVELERSARPRVDFTV